MHGRVLLALLTGLAASAMAAWSFVSGFAFRFGAVPALAVLGIALTLLWAVLELRKGPPDA